MASQKGRGLSGNASSPINDRAENVKDQRLNIFHLAAPLEKNSRFLKKAAQKLLFMLGHGR